MMGFARMWRKIGGKAAFQEEGTSSILAQLDRAEEVKLA